MANPYIATKEITIGNARAYVPGDEVAEDVVTRLGLQDSVARANSKAAKDAAEPAEGPSQP